MPLSPGDRLGLYEILAPLGAGGMGEVYRARDTDLNRDVALKVLPNVVAADPDRLARFEREAQALAALNHPHIAQIYGIERRGGTRALVMELVEGEDLSRTVARGPVPIDDAVAIARQVADALEAAHECGIIHRDLKPAGAACRDAAAPLPGEGSETATARHRGGTDCPRVAGPGTHRTGGPYHETAPDDGPRADTTWPRTDSVSSSARGGNRVKGS